MASGAVVIQIHSIVVPSSMGAGFGTRAGGSIPAEQAPYYAFEASIDQHLDLYCSLAGYGGGGLAVRLSGVAASAVTGGALMGVALRRLVAGTEDLDVAHSYVYTDGRLVVAPTAGALAYVTIPLPPGAAMDGLLDGEDFVLRLRRRGSNRTPTTGDDLAGALLLLALVGTEA